RFTLSTTGAVASVGGTATPEETGMTPIPPLNFNSSAAAGSEKTTPRNIMHANAFLITALLFQQRLWANARLDEARAFRFIAPERLSSFAASAIWPRVRQTGFALNAGDRPQVLKDGKQITIRHILKDRPGHYLEETMGRQNMAVSAGAHGLEEFRKVC